MPRGGLKVTSASAGAVYDPESDMHITCFGVVLGIGILGATLAGCGDEGTTSTGTSPTTSTGGTTSSSNGGSGGTTTTSTGGGGSTAGSGGTTSTTSTTGGGGTGGATTTSTGPEYGFCAKPCGVVGDCCPPDPNNEDSCPSATYPDNPACDNGACLPAQCATTADCTVFNPKHDCLPVSGFNSCKFPCASNQDCVLPLQCVGTDDNGNGYCLAPGGTGCSDDASCNGFGKCVDTVCVCAVDADCSFPGYTKCAL